MVFLGFKPRTGIPVFSKRPMTAVGFEPTPEDCSLSAAP